MTLTARAAGAGLGLAVLAAVIWGANAPMTVHGSDQAILRLAWSVRPERLESCRQQSEDELARLPTHMRQPVVCEGRSAQYRLTVRHEGRVVAEQVVHGGGLRQDRRIYVFHELPLPPGDGSIEVRFDRLDSDSPRVPPPEKDQDHDKTGDKDDRQGRAANRRAGGETVPAHMVFAQRLRVEPREVILVTYAPEQRALVGIQDGRPPAR
jgi:hypothetical protein